MKALHPVKGRPRSEAVLHYLDDHDYQYVAIRTEHGVHIVMYRPDWFQIESNRLNWFSALGIKLEAHVTKVFEPIKVNGIERQIIKGSLTDAVIYQSAPALLPIQKSREKPFLMEFQQGDRNNHLSKYAFYLCRSGFQADAIKEVIQAINTYVLEDPLPDSEIETILRPETMEKLQDIEERTKNGVVSPEVFKKFLKSLGISIRYNELLNIVDYENLPKEYQDIVDKPEK
ncbi:MAG: primase alpha helix C-terminal domain-containing protein [bacterium]